MRLGRRRIRHPNSTPRALAHAVGSAPRYPPPPARMYGQPARNTQHHTCSPEARHPPKPAPCHPPHPTPCHRPPPSPVLACCTCPAGVCPDCRRQHGHGLLQGETRCRHRGLQVGGSGAGRGGGVQASWLVVLGSGFGAVVLGSGFGTGEGAALLQAAPWSSSGGRSSTRAEGTAAGRPTRRGGGKGRSPSCTRGLHAIYTAAGGNALPLPRASLPSPTPCRQRARAACASLPPAGTASTLAPSRQTAPPSLTALSRSSGSRWGGAKPGRGRGGVGLTGAADSPSPRTAYIPVSGSALVGTAAAGRM